MRDPLTWSLPLGRLFGINIRVHLLFPIVALGLVGRVAYLDPRPELWLQALLLMIMLFLVVFLHELGHCFGARAVDGDAQDIMLWPLGGLAYADVPHTPRANFIYTAAGPAVNVVLCLAAVLLLAACGFVPSFNPVADPYSLPLTSWAEPNSPVVASKDGQHLAKFVGYQDADKKKVSSEKVGFKDDGTPYVLGEPDKILTPVTLKPEEVFIKSDKDGKLMKDENGLDYRWKDKDDESNRVRAEAVPNGLWVLQLSRFFWINWVLVLINLLPAFPLDGGNMLRCFLWWRSDFRHATLVALFTGFLIMFALLLVAIITMEPLVLCLAAVIFILGWGQWVRLETGGEESMYGDFSQGYTSLEREQDTPRPRRQSWFQRWLQKRAARKLQRELEEREAEERRMDELLEKIAREGKQSLTAEEQRFLTRVSAKYRNRQ
jgi:Zn-dependent protease